MTKWSNSTNLGATLRSLSTLMTSVHQLNTAVAAKRIIGLARNMTAKYNPKRQPPQNEFLAKQKVKHKIHKEQAIQILKKIK